MPKPQTIIRGSEHYTFTPGKGGSLIKQLPKPAPYKPYQPPTVKSKVIGPAKTCRSCGKGMSGNTETCASCSSNDISYEKAFAKTRRAKVVSVGSARG